MRVYLTDGGLETSLIFHQGIDLPMFAAFPLVQQADGRSALRAYWKPYLAVAREFSAAMAVDTATWRASRDWAEQLGYDEASLREVNAAAVGLATELAGALDTATVNGVIGPRGDGYVVGDAMTPEQAADYHAPQIQALASAGVDQVTAVTLTYPDEAVGFVQASEAAGVPAVVSFTVETDGRLPSGHALREAVCLVDEQTDHAALGFMINCAHPSHFEATLRDDGEWLHRIKGIRPNASKMSHAELDAADELDDGNPNDLADRCRQLMQRLPDLDLLGGCCGTDHRHIRAIATACLSDGPSRDA
jgi:S-methylmethionine-dependent homocysteine/selenocysteine methylase